MSPAASQRKDAGGAGRKKRPRPLPRVNARNLAIEKKRREQMNGNFLDLAYSVPSLAHTQRLTKVQIVNQTIEHLREQRDLCAVAVQDMQELLADNARLAAEVNMLRSAGMQGGSAAPVRPVPGTMDRLIAASQLGCGTATLRDANEGPEPRSRGVPATAEQTDTARGQPAAGFSPTDQNSGTMAQLYDAMWNTGYDFTGIPLSHQKQFLLSSSSSALPPEPSSLLTPAGVPTPPRDGIDGNVLNALTYPRGLLPDNSLYSMTDNRNGLDVIWSGIGI